MLRFLLLFHVAQDDNPPSVASSKCDSSSDVQDMKERKCGRGNRTSESDDDNSDDDNGDDDNSVDHNSDSDNGDDDNGDDDNGDNEMNENRANDNDSKNKTDNRKGSKRRRHESNSDDEMEGNTSHRVSETVHRMLIVWLVMLYHHSILQGMVQLY